MNNFGKRETGLLWFSLSLLLVNSSQQPQNSGGGDVGANGNALPNAESKPQQQPQPPKKSNKPPSGGGRRNDSKYSNKEPLVNGTSA